MTFIRKTQSPNLPKHRLRQPAIMFLAGLLTVLVGCSGNKGEVAESALMQTTESNNDNNLPWPFRNQQLDSLLNKFSVPGIAVATLTTCDLDRVFTSGMANLETNQAVSTATLFEAASLSKPVFTYIVMQLVEEGVIDLERPIAKDFSYSRIPNKEWYNKITPRMVLSHRTGMPNWVDNKTLSASIPFDSAPGGNYSYSGEAFTLLQKFVEYKTGKSLQELFRHRLGGVMPHSTFVLPAKSKESDKSKGYQVSTDPKSGREMRTNGGGLAASTLITTAGDYARFVSLICKEKTLSAKLHQDMLTPQTPVPAGDFPGPTAFGLGWLILQMSANDNYVFHTGNNTEYRAFAGFNKNKGNGLVILTNGRNGWDLITAMLEQMEQ